jgi:Transketolase, thiamine diphosphate binding domain
MNMTAAGFTTFAGPELARLRQLTANTIRGLSMDAVQKANSGHSGMPMGIADAAVVLWTSLLNTIRRTRCGLAATALYSRQARFHVAL